MTKKIIAGIAILSALAPFAIFAQGQPPVPDLTAQYGTYGGIVDFINNVIGGWMFGLLMALAVIFILYAAFLYLTASGDEEKVGKAKKIIIYALIAIAIALLAKALVALIVNSISNGAVSPAP